MTFEEWWGDEPKHGMITAREAWNAGWKAGQAAMTDGKTIYVPQHVYDMLRDILVAPKESIKALKAPE